MIELIIAMFSINNIAFVVPLAGFGTATYAVSFLELWATIFGLASVIGARMNKIWWYPIGIINSIGFIAIFFQIQLYSDLLLNFYFIGMSVFGWYIWTRRRDATHYTYPIRYMNMEKQLKMVIVIMLGTIVLGANIDFIFNGMAQFVAGIIGTTYIHTPAALPYWDAFTTISSLVAMYLLAKRYVESWVLWVIVDVVCVGLYMYKGVIAMSVEYFVFLLNAIYALYQWHKAAVEHKQEVS